MHFLGPDLSRLSSEGTEFVRLRSRLLILMSVLLVLSFTILALLSYERERKHILDMALQQARDIRAVLMAVRRVYHHQFLNSGLPLTDKTLGFLPAHSLGRISKEFSNWSDSGIDFNNVSDRPRNPENAADAEELKAIRWFRKHPEEKERMVLVQEPGKPPYYQYSHPIWIETYCLRCHGRREEAPPAIRNRYTTAFDYKLGDLRGIVSIKIPAEPMQDYLFRSWLTNLLVLGATLIAIWIALNGILRRLVFSRLERMETAVKRFGRGDYDAPLPLQGEDELTTVARTLREMADQIKQREQDLERSRRLYRTLSETNQLILRLEKPETLYGEVCRIAVEEGGFQLAWIGVPDTEYLYVLNAQGMTQYLEQKPLSLENAGSHESLILLAYHQGHIQLCNHLSTDADAQAWHLRPAHEGLSSAAALPLQVGEQTIGVFVLYAEQAGFFSEEILNLLKEMVRDVAFAWNNYQREADLVHSRKRVQYLAYHDTLTGLPNRALLRERLAQALRRCHRYGHSGALFFLDIDRFKQINSSFGHLVGDALLRQVSQDLKRILYPADTLAHIGGDEFLVLAEELSATQNGLSHHARILADKLRKALDHEYVIEGHPIHIRVSIGIALFPNDDGNEDQLLRHAATAMHRAKAQGGDTICFFDTAMEEDAQARMTLERELREALVQGQFFLVYQPQVDVRNHRLIGFEALLRWQHPHRGLVGPDQFIPVLEETGLILPVGAWLTDQACAQLNRWHRAGLWQEGMRLALNLSPRQLREADCTARLLHITEANGVDLSWLELEVTEGMILTEEQQSVKKLKALRSLGISIAVDDFGTGHSSLHRLNRLPLDTLKIDRSFISALPEDARSRALVEAIITLGKQLGLQVLIEGVETQKQRDFLLKSGCDFMQGFLFSRPLSAEAVEDLLRGWPQTGTGLSS